VTSPSGARPGAAQPTSTLSGSGLNRAVNEAYWAKHPDGPFATLIRVAATYCDPEQDMDAYDDLKYLARQDDDAEMKVFKAELRQALNDPSRLPGDELH
jgi:hypothetical protein